MLSNIYIHHQSIIGSTWRGIVWITLVGKRGHRGMMVIHVLLLVGVITLMFFLNEHVGGLCHAAISPVSTISHFLLYLALYPFLLTPAPWPRPSCPLPITGLAPVPVTGTASPPSLAGRIRTCRKCSSLNRMQSLLSQNYPLIRLIQFAFSHYVEHVYHKLLSVTQLIYSPNSPGSFLTSLSVDFFLSLLLFLLSRSLLLLRRLLSLLLLLLFSLLTSLILLSLSSGSNLFTNKDFVLAHIFWTANINLMFYKLVHNSKKTTIHPWLKKTNKKSKHEQTCLFHQNHPVQNTWCWLRFHRCECFRVPRRVSWVSSPWPCDPFQHPQEFFFRLSSSRQLFYRQLQKRHNHG